MDGSGWVQERARRDRRGRFAAGVDLHPACIVGRKCAAHFAGDGEAAITAADDAPLFRPTSDSCIRPAISRRAALRQLVQYQSPACIRPAISRRAAPIDPGAAADDLHSALRRIPAFGLHFRAARARSTPAPPPWMTCISPVSWGRTAERMPPKTGEPR
jgi:hypothetical protein